MSCTVNDTLIYVLLLTRHIRKGDVPRAILTVLLELGFQPQSDGFGYLRKAIFLKYENSDQRINPLYISVGQWYDPEVGNYQVEQAIRTAIDAAWRNRDDEKWRYFFHEGKSGKLKKPSNGEFIARIACVMELWYGCCKEVSYATK